MPPFYRAPEYPFAQSLQAMMQAREQQRARKEQQENNVVGGLQTFANAMYKNKSDASAADAEARKLVAKEMLSNLLAGKMTTQRPSPVDVNPGAMRSPLDLNTSQVNVGSPQPYTMSNEDYINVVRTGSLPKDVTAVPTNGTRSGTRYEWDEKIGGFADTGIPTGTEANSFGDYGKPEKQVNPFAPLQRQRIMGNLISQFNNDSVVMKSRTSLAAAGDIRALAESGNPIGAASIPTFAARMAGEVGALTEADKAPFGGSRAVVNRVEQSLKQMADGQLTPENKEFVIGLTSIIEKRANEKMNDTARKRAKQYSKIKEYGTEEEIYNMFIPEIDIAEPQKNPVGSETGNGLTPEKKARLDALRAKKAAGTLGR